MLKRIFGLVSVVVGLVIGVSSSAFAALDFTGVALNTADVETVMGLVIPALAALWGFRKIIKTMNRS